MPDEQPPHVQAPQSFATNWWSDFFHAFIAAVVSPETGGWLGDLAESVAGRVVSVLFAFIFKIQGTLVQLVSKSIDDVDQAAAPSILKMASSGLSAFFGVPVGPEAISARGGQAGNKALAEQLGALVFKGLFDVTPEAGGPTGQEGLRNAQTLVGLGVNLAITGYINDAFLPPVVHEYLPAFKDLKDVVTANLGLARLTRRGLSPVLNAHIVNPLTRYLNTVYRPTLLSEAQAVRALNTKTIDEATYFDIMAQRGYTRELAGALRAQNSVHLSKSELRQLRELGELGDAEITTILTAQGYSTETADALLTLMEDDRVATYLAELATAAKAAYADRAIDEATFRQLMSQAGLSSRETEALFALASMERARPKRLTLAEAHAAYMADLMTVDDYRDHLELEGYSERDVLVLQAIAVKDKTTAEAKLEARKPLPQPGAGVALPQAVISELYRRGITDETTLRTQLGALGFKGANLDALVADLTAKRHDYLVAQQKHQKLPTGAKLPTSTAKEGYVRGITSRADLEAFYLAVGYSPPAVSLLLQLADTDRTAYQARLARAAGRTAAATKAPPAL